MFEIQGSTFINKRRGPKGIRSFTFERVPGTMRQNVMLLDVTVNHSITESRGLGRQEVRRRDTTTDPDGETFGVV